MQRMDKPNFNWAIVYFGFALAVLLVGNLIGILLNDDWVVLGGLIMGGTIFLRGVVEFFDILWLNRP